MMGGSSIKQECVEVQDSQSAPSTSQHRIDHVDDDCKSDDDEGHLSQIESRPSKSRESVHVSVHRQEISAVQVQEGTEELQGLGVDVYDQQTYEKSVFDQVERAISEPSKSLASTIGPAERTTHGPAVDQQNSHDINSLLRLIQNQGQDADDSSDQDIVRARDEEILQLTRQQRLNRAVKQENITLDDSTNISLTQPSLHRMPRIPRINQSQSDDSISERPESSGGAVQFATIVQPKCEPKLELAASRTLESSFLDDVLEDGELSSLAGSESSASEYQPPATDEDSGEDGFGDENEELVYETDEDPDAELLRDIDPDVESKSTKIKDDGDFKSYAARIKAYNRSRAKMRLDNIDADGVERKRLDETITIDSNLKIPTDIWTNLFEHQKTGVRWLWELHQLGTGGILGDEMGLGKTIQMIAFLVALKSSNIANLHNNYENLGPTVLVCPATVMHQWLQEFRKWYPPFRVAILHSTGTFSGDRKQLVQVVHRSNGILICSYPGVIIYQDYLHALDWHYAILDEGHKIKNPDSQVTLACKRFRTPHRIILSGSPVQNNLRELWSIFDFIYPGKLGTLPVFLGQFAIPITQGGYANATDVQVQIAYKCACVLRDTIKPFLLRRTKAEVNSKLKLPERSEQVLFCRLTDKQRKLYQHYLESPTVRDIKRGTLQIFVGLIQLRKICNHPDIFDSSECDRQMREKQKHQEKRSKHLEFFSADETYGHYHKSGKMMVVDALLKLWKKQGDKVLLFTQSRQMLKIFTQYLRERQYSHLLMDGSTPIGQRQSLIEEFNTNEDIFVFLLTTRVGGVGVNLIGANRIIIYDPDWNPSTDIQARERAWRIGQQRHVIIYRLLTAGTIEEKIYHRQVFKLYLTNRILKDAKQKRFFKTNDLHELFALGHDDKNIETKALFDDDLQIDEKSIKKSRKSDRKHDKKRVRMSKQENALRSTTAKQTSSRSSLTTTQLPEEKLREMREQARRLSQMIASQYGSKGTADQSRDETDKLTNKAISFDALEPGELVEVDDIDDFSPNPLSTNEPDVAAIPYCPSSSSSSLASRSRTSHGLEDGDPKPKTKSKKPVDYLVKQDIYKPQAAPGTEELDGGGSGSRYKRDDYILERLFKNSNIYGALKHDRIESDTTADFKVVESEAEKVARDAIRALRESRRHCLGSTSGIPNWTGRNGQVVAPTNRLVPKNKARASQIARSAATTSRTSAGRESILSSIKKRGHSNPVALSEHRSGVGSEDEETNRDFVGRAEEAGAEDMADKLRDYFMFQSATRGEAQTNDVLEFFKQTFKPDKTAIFKALLYKMCEFQRRADQGFWKLKGEFRDMSF